MKEFDAPSLGLRSSVLVVTYHHLPQRRKRNRVTDKSADLLRSQKKGEKERKVDLAP